MKWWFIFVGGRQLFALCPWHFRPSTSLDDRLWKDGTTSSTPGPGPSHSMARWQPWGRIPVGPGQPNRNPELHDSGQIVSGALTDVFTVQDSLWPDSCGFVLRERNIKKTKAQKKCQSALADWWSCTMYAVYCIHSWTKQSRCFFFLFFF